LNSTFNTEFLPFESDKTLNFFFAFFAFSHVLSPSK
jgi:hypothetical protein